MRAGADGGAFQCEAVLPPRAAGVETEDRRFS